ncbi:MAG TPA: helical backbone metal receptor, partial [Quisquiliibacterium sp.]|nr:helical backbone metal receptor [Quisquiliibacterium sp.]
MPLLDALGEPHRPARADVRIVSLVPSLTELLCDLGLAGSIVGRTGFCIHPREVVRGIPKVGGTKDVDVERVRALAPTHLLVNVDENERPAVDALRPHVGSVVVTHPIEVADNFALYRLLGGIFRREEAAARLEERLRAELDAARSEAFEPLRVLYLIWRNPWMTVGASTYIARMLAEVGLEAVAPEDPARYPQVDFDGFGPERFDAVLLSTEPYRFTDAHRHELLADPRLAGRPVRLIDGEMTS